jgi:anhydro-N-acetylmuramic acid kinase
MSGTSVDGVDAALVRTDGERIHQLGPAHSAPYDPAFRDALKARLGQRSAPDNLVAELTDRHAEAVTALLGKVGLDAADVDVVGFHGQTLVHEPAHGITVQIGDGARLAAALGIPVVDDFRSADVAAGGEGAPLAPLYHQALAEPLTKPLAVLNVGGVANVTWIGADGSLLAFDTGPGNALIDDWCTKTVGRALDEGGRLAKGGTVDLPALGALLDNPYFAQAAPKSLDRDAFDAGPVAGFSPADGAATLTAFTAKAVEKALDHLPEAPLRWLVCGGGRRNGTLMAMLGDVLGVAVDAAEVEGWDGDAIEAQAFAFLAVRSLKGLALSLPSTTGVSEPKTGGTLHVPPGRKQ